MTKGITMSTITSEATESEDCVEIMEQGEDENYFGPDDDELETMDYDDLVTHYSDLSGGC